MTRIRAIAILCLVLAGVLRPAAAQIRLAWSRTYGPNGSFSPVAMTLDGQSNVCVTGIASNDFVTVKYSPAGVQLWADRYDNALYDSPKAIVADAEGQVWITGVSSTNHGAGDIITIKYGKDGTRRWVQRFNHPINHPGINNNRFVGLAVDSAGNAYVTGNAWPTGGSSVEYLIIKYSPDGQQVWVQRFPMPTGSTDASVKGIALDQAGNVVVAGDVPVASSNPTFVTVKYDPSGNLQWAAVEERTGGVRAMAVDPPGNVYVTGSQFTTVKYSPTGEVLWFTTRPAGGRGVGSPVDLKVDAEGHVIVTGYEWWRVSEDEEQYELLTLRYDAAGNETWSARSTVFQNRIAHALALDAEGNIYVGGEAYDGALLLKYAPNGSQLLELIVPSAFQDLEVDAAGNVYIADINFFGTGGYILRYVQTPLPSQPTAIIVPARAQVPAGSNITFTAVVSGPGPFTYQWTGSGYPLPGETNSTLTITNMQSWQQADYSVIVSNSSAYTRSPEARLVLLVPPAFVTQPSDQHPVIGKTATFVAKLSGTEPLSYQWQFDGMPRTGATNASLVLSNAQPSDAGHYVLVVTNAGGSITSRVAHLSFVPSPLSWTNSTPIDIPDAAAVPYPSVIAVSGLTGTVAKVVVTLHGLTHLWTPDLDILLGGPGGQTVVLMSAAGNRALVNATFTFDDDAPFKFSGSDFATGTFTVKPTNFRVGFHVGIPDDFPWPAPSGPFGATFSVFSGSNPNGPWSLFVNDGVEEGAGQIADGWELKLFGPGQVTVSKIKFNSVTRTGDYLTLRWNGAPGLRLQRASSLADPDWMDVPGSDGQSLIQIPIGNGSEFFRLIAR